MQTVDQVLTQVNTFTYFVSTIAINRINMELDTSNTFKALDGLRKRVSLNKEFYIKTKCTVYHTTVLSTILHGAETWRVNQANDKILNVKWRQHITNKSIREKSKLLDLYNILVRRNVLILP